MKLYTEADLKKVISIYSEEYKTSTDEILKELNLTPIELPTDEEIETEAIIFFNQAEALSYEKAFYTIGAKWLRDKIQRSKQ
jgi:elongation factor P hydroxylase